MNYPNPYRETPGPLRREIEKLSRRGLTPKEHAKWNRIERAEKEAKKALVIDIETYDDLMDWEWQVLP